MTSIVKETPSNTFFESIERFATAKETGALTGDELSKILELLGSIYSNLVRRGLRTEEEAEEFLNQMPNGKWNCFNYAHKGQEIAYKTVEQDINAALYDQEKISMQSQPVKRK